MDTDAAIKAIERILRVVGTLISLWAMMKKLAQWIDYQVYRKPPDLD